MTAPSARPSASALLVAAIVVFALFPFYYAVVTSLALGAASLPRRLLAASARPSNYVAVFSASRSAATS